MKKGISKFFAVFFLAISFLAFFSAKWYIEVYGDTGFESILFTLLAGVDGTSDNLISDWITSALIPTLLYTIFISLILLVDIKWHLSVRFSKKRNWFRIFPFKKWFRIGVCIILCVSLITSAVFIVGIPEYLEGIAKKTTLYEDNYVSPNDVEIKFPKQKRNLIYIFLESMETTFLSKELGGGKEQNIIPELYQLAEENVNFSHNSGVGGWPVITNTIWTVGGMVAQTAGIPLSIPINGNDYGAYNQFLPGVTTINNILKEEGYYQTLLFGSDASFGGRDKYFNCHGLDRIYDVHTASDDGIVPKNYHVWWGYEDLYLFRYAKQILTEISVQDKPFALTMLTADTHHVGGYRCELCKDEYGENYENVYACSSKQVYEFVEWIKKQDFYENTTIVICGDHLSMDSGYFDRNIDSSYERHVYNCFINSAFQAENSKNREFSTMDLFPTTLAAMGCEIEGERLGLGVNLFSGVPTLCEQNGTNWLNEEIAKSSPYYASHFIK